MVLIEIAILNDRWSEGKVYFVKIVALPVEYIKFNSFTFIKNRPYSSDIYSPSIISYNFRINNNLK